MKASGSPISEPAGPAPTPTPGPLHGTRVLDLTHVLAGPFCTMILAQLGADVVKIEQPGQGDSGRSRGPHRVGPDGDRAHAEIIHLGRDKRSLPIDLAHPRGRQLFLELVGVSDVVVHNFRPRAMERLGLGYDTLRTANPQIIYACISGWGHKETAESPYIDRPAFNIIAQAMSGIMDITGAKDGPPVPTAVALGDFVPALYSVIGVLAALEHRHSTGLGRLVDVSMYDALLALNVRALVKYAINGEVQQRGENLFNAAMGIFKVADGYVATTFPGQPMWQRFCDAIGRADLVTDPRVDTDANRGKNFESVIRPATEAWAEKRSKAEATKILLDHDIPAGPVQGTSEIFADPHVAARRMLADVGDMVGGVVQVPDNPIKFHPDLSRPPRQAQWLGEGTEEVLQEYLKMTPEEVRDLASEGVVGAFRRR